MYFTLWSLSILTPNSGLTTSRNLPQTEMGHVRRRRYKVSLNPVAVEHSHWRIYYYYTILYYYYYYYYSI